MKTITLRHIFTEVFFVLAAMTWSCEKKESTDQSETAQTEVGTSKDRPLALVIHGGAGTIKRENMSEEMEKAYREKLQEALEAGYKVLETGGTSVEAVRSARGHGRGHAPPAGLQAAHRYPLTLGCREAPAGGAHREGASGGPSRSGPGAGRGHPGVRELWTAPRRSRRIPGGDRPWSA